MNWNDLAIGSQILFTLWFALTHWVSIPKLNDLSQEAFENEKKMNLVFHLFQVASIIGFIFTLRWLMWIGVINWTLTFFGNVICWWIPYFWGWPKGFLKNAEVDNERTYHFLPKRKNHPIPDLTHCLIGVFALLACVTSWMALLE